MAGGAAPHTMRPHSGRAPFTYSAEKRAAFDQARERVKDYDVYKQFPLLPSLARQRYTPEGAVLVTGAAGFIASHVAIRLARLYPSYRVIGLDRISYCSDERFVIDPLADCVNFRFVRADVCDYKVILELMREERVDTVLHLAAQSHVDLSFKTGGPQQFVRDNVQGTASLLEASRAVGVRRFVMCSTDEVYGEGSFDNRVSFDESSSVLPTNPYSASKAGAEAIARSFYKSFGFPVVITRGNNVFGPHQFYEKCIPKFIAQLRLGRKLTIHGNGLTTRNFLHVQDTASAFDTVLHCGEDGEAYNIGGVSEKSVLDVAADLLLLMGLEDRQHELVEFVVDRPHNDACYPIVCAKLRSLGWREQLSWEFGLANTASWFLERLRSNQGRDLSRFIDAHPSYSAGDKILRREAAALQPVRASLPAPVSAIFASSGVRRSRL
eukprot:TRINITY_DN4330_c0_g2_i1.p1 TRINITY_DN4330_c0_g2~~TRINITY_DN4330_c0_g2_i1.p1  ORF type:complete len:438 (-),score=30.70 TRINITY_DN4330_c0_g2_i1:240-1553(-)